MNIFLKQLHDAAILRDQAATPQERSAAFDLMTAAHAALLKHVQNARKSAPEWDLYPRGRDAFLQNDPWVRVR